MLALRRQGGALMFPKRCNCCGREHDANEWFELRYVGEIDDGVEVLELRDCACRSSLAIVVRESVQAVAS